MIKRDRTTKTKSSFKLNTVSVEMSYAYFKVCILKCDRNFDK